MEKTINITNQLNTFGLSLPNLPSDEENNLINSGYLFAETISLWEKKIKYFKKENKNVFSEILNINNDSKTIPKWELYLLSLFSFNDLDDLFNKWETSIKLIHSLKSEKVKTIGIFIYFARNKKLHHALLCFSNLLENKSISIQDFKSCASLLIREYDDKYELNNSINNIYGIEQLIKFNKIKIYIAMLLNDDNLINIDNLKKKITKLLSDISQINDKIYSLSFEICNYLEIEVKNNLNYKDDTKSNKNPEIVIVYSGHLRSFETTYKSHKEKITDNYKSVINIMHTWDSQYPDTISWRGYIETTNQLNNTDQVKENLLKLFNPNYLQIDSQKIDDKFINNSNNTINPIDGMHYGSRFFKFSKLYSIIMTLKYLEDIELKENIPVVLIRPDILLLEKFDIRSAIEEAKEKAVFCFNKSPDNKYYKAVDCIMICYSNQLKKIFKDLTYKNLILSIQDSFKPFSKGQYNSSWTIKR